jgi:hypothetical protein
MSDIWNGKPLPERDLEYTTIHYRLYDDRTGQLLSFNSTNSVDAIVTDVLRTQKENPDARLRAIEYDGPAYPN